MKYELNGSELSVLLMSLIQRRNNIKGLLNIESISANSKAGYSEEMSVVDGLLEKFFPGSVARLVKAAA